MKLLATALIALALLPGITCAIGADDLVGAAPNITLGVAERALDAVHCTQDAGKKIDKLIVIDMSLGSKSRRLWAFDLKDPSNPKMILNDRVAHGAGSDRDGDGIADEFSNTPNSHMTSLGLYKISERYQGKNGWSRRLDGLLARWNSNARDRAVVMHPSTYVNEGRVGRSQGCPAVNQKTMDALEAAGLSNAVLWIDGNSKELAMEVADCAAKKRVRLDIQREAIEVPFLMASSYQLPGLAAMPVMYVMPKHAQEVLPNYKQINSEALIASMKMNYVSHCNSWEWSLDHWVRSPCRSRDLFARPVLPNSDPALQQMDGHPYSRRSLPSRIATTYWGS